MDILSSYSTQVDDLLQRICFKLQLTKTQRDNAESRYAGIAKYLIEDSGILSSANLNIYPQGSLRLGTTVKPINDNEYDLDLVCELNLNSKHYTPSMILDVVEKRLKQNDTYGKLIKKRKNRCIRLDYANEFHLDIVPAIPDSATSDSRILVPDRELKIWLSSNPKGYAKWFEDVSMPYFKLIEMRQVEPLPKEDDEQKTPLKYIVQLMKRHRDMMFDGIEEKFIPKSIIITTLAGNLYAGIPSINDGMTVVLKGIFTLLQNSQTGPFKVLNPANTMEDLAETWKEMPDTFKNFKQWIINFYQSWNLMVSGSRQETIKKLEALFGETVTKEALQDQTKYIDLIRRQGGLRMNPSVGSLTTLNSVNSIPVKSNTFFGK